MSTWASSFIESFYSLKIFRLINKPISLITGIIPISISEVSLYFLLILVVFKLFVFIKNMIKTPKVYLNKTFLKRMFKRILLIVLILYFSFLILWGLNYYRMPLAQSLGLPVAKYSKNDLMELCQYLIDESNSLRKGMNEDKNGVMTISEGRRWVLRNAYFGYDAISHTFTVLSGKYGTPKPVMLSELMCYTGITGIYFPFTGEANININTPLPSLPHVVTHEMAHQRGYAREDEANFIAYLTCIFHWDVKFKYSGHLLALTHSMNALYKEDKENYDFLKNRYSDGLKRDLTYINTFWKKYDGPVEKISNDLNDAYLKANNQKDGVKSYGRMVDLLIAYHKNNENISHIF